MCYSVSSDKVLQFSYSPDLFFLECAGSVRDVVKGVCHYFRVAKGEEILLLVHRDAQQSMAGQ